MENWVLTIQEDVPELNQKLDGLMARILEKKAQLDAKRPLSVSAVQKLREQLNIEWSYNSNAIEGNTLNLNETRLVLQEGITIKGKSFKEHLEVSNHHDAIDFVESLIQSGARLSHIELRSIHALVMQKVDKEFAGEYRNGAIRITGAKFNPPQAFEIQELITSWLDFLNMNPLQLNPISLSAVMHHRLVWIHPFFDGNGRTARLFMNLYLMKLGFPPAIIMKSDRKKYYEALKQADSGHFSKLVLLVGQAIERSLDIYLSAHSDSTQYYKPISDMVNKPEMPYSQEYLSLLARQGKIDAYKEGNVWYTSDDAVIEYVANRKRKRDLS